MEILVAPIKSEIEKYNRIIASNTEKIETQQTVIREAENEITQLTTSNRKLTAKVKDAESRLATATQLVAQISSLIQKPAADVEDDDDCDDIADEDSVPVHHGTATRAISPPSVPAAVPVSSKKSATPATVVSEKSGIKSNITSETTKPVVTSIPVAPPPAPVSVTSTDVKGYEASAEEEEEVVEEEQEVVEDEEEVAEEEEFEKMEEKRIGKKTYLISHVTSYAYLKKTCKLVGIYNDKTGEVDEFSE